MVNLAFEEGKITKYEKARLIGARSLQISMGAPIMIKTSPKILEDLKYDPLEIAKLEFAQGLLPLVLKRQTKE